jgi:stage VI sporulation protein D
LSIENQSYLRFSLEESVWFQKGQEVAELLSISLDPNITIVENDQYVSIRGSLELTGEYKRFDEEPAEYEMQKPAPKYIHSVEERGEGICEFLHRFPVDITIPKDRIQSVYDLDVAIDSFDYVVPERSCLKLVADLTISGLYGDQQNHPAAEKAQEEEAIREESSVEKELNEANQESRPFSGSWENSFHDENDANQNQKEAQETALSFSPRQPEEEREQDFAFHRYQQEKAEEPDFAFRPGEDEDEEEFVYRPNHPEEEAQIPNMILSSPFESKEEESEFHNDEEISFTAEAKKRPSSVESVATPFSLFNQPKEKVLQKASDFSFAEKRSQCNNDESVPEPNAVFKETEEQIEGKVEVEEAETESSSSSPNGPAGLLKKFVTKKKSMSIAEFLGRKSETEQLTKLKVCIVQQGDTIDSLSERYKLPVQQILRVNQLEANQDVYEGQVLYIPNSPTKK